VKKFFHPNSSNVLLLLIMVVTAKAGLSATVEFIVADIL
jgi:hypothetical protein